MKANYSIPIETIICGSIDSIIKSGHVDGDTLKSLIKLQDMLKGSTGNLNAFQIMHLIDSAGLGKDTINTIYMNSLKIVLISFVNNALFKLDMSDSYKKKIMEGDLARSLTDSTNQNIKIIKCFRTDFVKDSTSILVDKMISNLNDARIKCQKKDSIYSDYYRRDTALIAYLNNPKFKQTVGVPFSEIMNFNSSDIPVPLGSEMPAVDKPVMVSSSSNELSESKAIDAVGSFIAEQFEQDIVASLLDEFERIAKGKKIDYLFPRTVSLLSTLGSEGSPLTDITSAIRRSMYDDLHTIYDSLANHKCDSTSLFFVNDTLRTVLKIVADINEKINAGYDPVQLFDYLYREYYNYGNLVLPGISQTGQIKKLVNLFQFIYVIQSAFRDTTKNGNFWVPPSQIAKLDQDLSQQSGKILAALLYIELKKNNDVWASLGSKWIKKTSDKNFIAKCYGSLMQLDKLQKAVKRLSSDKSSSTANLINNYYISYLDLIKNMAELYSYVTDEKVDTNFIGIFRNISYGYKSILAGDYSTILASTISIANEFLDIHVQQIRSLNTPQDSIHADSVLNLGRKDIQYFSRYLTLFIDLVNAKNQTDLKNAISRASNMSGGFMAKKTNGFKMSLDAYPGIFGGVECVPPQKMSGNFGLSCPIGLDFSWDKHNEGFIISIFDFGPVVSYRVTNGESKGFPSNVTFAQLVSPGVFLKYSPFKYNALTVLLGMQWTPALRSIVDSATTVSKDPSLRYGLSLTYDIPFLYFAQEESKYSNGGFMDEKGKSFNMSIDGYVGMFGGRECATSQKPSSNIGFLCPIGLDLSWNKYNSGFMISLFDFASVLSYSGSMNNLRISNGTYGQILSPGVFIKRALCNNTSWTIMAGIEDNISVLGSDSFVRYGIALAYNIPLFFLVK